MHSYKKQLSKKEILPADNGDLIEIVNVLQNKLAASGHTLDISLPQIVVVGCQSAGKSSVLENIVGREFLPRGTGVVTRRPTVVQLQPYKEEFVVFLHKPGTKFKDFQKVKAEIEKETLRVPGPVGFSSLPIALRIFSPNVLKLTLVDLPGLIRVTLDTQSEDSIKEVRNMVLEYIKQPNSLILAVSPANQDIANSDALEIAKTVDPQRIRTIGVLTKLDLMDDGTDAKDILENKKMPLKRGFIGVLNRSQRDIEAGKDIGYCLEKEKHFFASTPCYRHISDKMGTPYLKKLLNKQLHIHIRESLPAVRQEVLQKLASLHRELKEFNIQIGRNVTESFGIQFYMIKIVQRFIERFHIEIFGYSEEVTVNELSAGSMINYKLCKNVHKNLKLPKVPGEEKLLTIIANLHGMRNSLSLPSLALETVTNHLLAEYIDPLNNLVDDIADTLFSNVEKSSKMLENYPNLRNKLLYLIKNSIDQAAVDTKESLERHMKAEMYFVNTYHQDFVFPEFTRTQIPTFFPMMLWDHRTLNNPTVDSTAKNNATNCDETEAIKTLTSNACAKENAKILSNIIQKYMIIQQKHITDMAIKYILFFLVKAVMDFVKKDLVPTILESSDSESIFEDCEKDFSRITEIESTCQCLKDALNAVQTF